VADEGGLQFDRAEPAGGPAVSTCAGCHKPISDTYFEVNGQLVCPSCRRVVEDQWTRGGSAGRFSKALVLGLLAMIACSIVWYAVLKLTDSQWGILAVVVGLVVGSAVRKGSNGRGGWRYQTLAIVLTYTAIVSSYVPFIIEGIREKSGQVSEQASGESEPLVKGESAKAAATETPGLGQFAIAVVMLLLLLYATPFLAGLQNAIGILIIGFALYEAWKLNKKVELRVTGPYQVAASAGGGQAAPA
jgi:hypothetical protein